MDRAYEGDKMRAVAKKLGYNPVAPPKKNRIDPWEYDRIIRLMVNSKRKDTISVCKQKNVTA